MVFDLKSVRSSVKVQTRAVRKDRKKESQLINSCCLSFYSCSCIEVYICVNLVLLQSISIQVLNQPNWSYSVFKCGHSQQIWGIWLSGETLNFKYKFKTFSSDMNLTNVLTKIHIPVIKYLFTLHSLHNTIQINSSIKRGMKP